MCSLEWQPCPPSEDLKHGKGRLTCAAQGSIAEARRPTPHNNDDINTNTHTHTNTNTTNNYTNNNDDNNNDAEARRPMSRGLILAVGSLL